MSFTVYRPLALVAAVAAVVSGPAAADELLGSSAKFAGITELVVEFSSVEIEARTGGTSLVLERVGVPGSIVIELERQGNTLRVVQRREWIPLPVRNPGKVIISVPDGTVARLSTTSGGVSLEGLSAKALVISTTSGGAEISGCEGKLEVSATSGSVSIRRHDGSFELASTSGHIGLDSVKGSGVVKTTSGGATLDRVEGRLACQATSGSIDGRELELTGDSSFSTTSGSIDLGLQNTAKDLRFELSATSGALLAGDWRGSRLLGAGSGPILVAGSSTSGSQTYRLR